MRIIILGCSRLGAQLAVRLEAKGHEVTILDRDGAAFATLDPEDFRGRRIVGDALEVDALREAGIETADAFVACTSGDNRNLTACQFARELFGVPKVISKVSDPLRGQIYADLGLLTVSPTVFGADLLHEALLDGKPAGC
ncbi:MAG: potassium channel family protein [Chloroflexota bacterium]